MSNGRLPIPVQRPNGTTNSGTLPSTSTVCFFFFLILFLVINNHRKDGVSVFCSDNLMNVHVILFYYLQSMPQSQSQTVVVENPMSVDSSGKLVNVIAFH
jgi:hypothetical protein